MQLWSDGSDGWGTAVDCIHYKNAVKVARKLTNRDREPYAVLDYTPEQRGHGFTVVAWRVVTLARAEQFVCHVAEVSE